VRASREDSLLEGPQCDPMKPKARREIAGTQQALSLSRSCSTCVYRIAAGITLTVEEIKECEHFESFSTTEIVATTCVTRWLAVESYYHMKLRTLVMMFALAAALCSVGYAQKEDAKEAADSAGRATKKTGRKMKRGTKKATHKAADKTEEGADKVKDKTR
jgi:hypothetical protein